MTRAGIACHPVYGPRIFAIILEYDPWLMNHAEKVAMAIENLATVSDDGETLPAAPKELDALDLCINERTKLLAGGDIG